ncbi:hypothetical protein COV06_04515 [Candidatus Uhrbacteria bacterium CG10_big_fil_rev_8_21_14_0_10_50_16]|uniref:Intracellular proteinase inhibitor BsuPI domain-containing protein n=1 Tax=Candidatus Uhrbacteria bacterium CG10_big_fil_rev_8_21_14_0_10_50_16 TaxID=1975039 RepID=A0A2H0RLL1_9BACT|nr:MAG: hypothetical protein COV06_04515 [Candidatus Uhrbacteria bacterium CG10_big_fil_rev_8_21_14_0_10_50_16]
MHKTIGIAATLGMLVLMGAGCTTGNTVSADITVPPTVEEGADFPILVRVTNNYAEAKNLKSIKFDSDIFKGLYMNDSVPEEDDWNSAADGSYTSFYDQLVVSPGSSRDVTLNMNALWEGDYLGNMEICFEGVEPCLLETTSVRVTAAQ